MNRTRPLVLAVALLAAALAGCASTTIDEGHRGLVFSPLIGMEHEVLVPGRHRLRSGERVEIVDVRYARREERVRTYTPDGHVATARVTVLYRPIISELYQLVTEVGPDYYAKVVGPGVRDATREALEVRPPEGTMVWRGSQLEQQVEAAARRRVAGKHVEITEVTLEDVQYDPPPLGS